MAINRVKRVKIQGGLGVKVIQLIAKNMIYIGPGLK